MRMALYQPDIPQNAGACLRLAACLGLPLDLVEPLGFVMDDRRLRRVGMDYVEAATWRRHASFEALRAACDGRIVLATTRGAVGHVDFAYQKSDTILLGRESSGVPDDVHAAVDARVRIMTVPGARSLNIVTAAAIIVGEALRQTGGFCQTGGAD